MLHTCGAIRVDYACLQDWIRVLDAAIRDHGDRVVLAAHSLGCATVAHWAARYKRVIAGRCSSDRQMWRRLSYPSGTTGFTPMPLDRLPFPTIVVASRSQFVTFERAQYFANCWGAALEDAGNAGHLNADSWRRPVAARQGVAQRTNADQRVRPLFSAFQSMECSNC